jgi:hypothetical protein
MGVTEETGKAVGTIAESLKSTPLALALVVVNVLFLAFVTFIAFKVDARNEQERAHQNQTIDKLTQQCFDKIPRAQ